MDIVASGTVFEGRAGTAYASSAFASLCVTVDGGLVVGFRCGADKGGPDGNVYVTTSADGGTTWSERVAPFDTALDGACGSHRAMNISEIAPGRLLAVTAWFDRTKGDLPLFDPETEGLLPVKNRLWESVDDGRTWSDVGVLDTTPFHQACTTGPILRVRPGVLVAFYETNKDYNDPSPWHHQAIVKFSYDEGGTWPDHGLCAADPAGNKYYWDQRPAALRRNVLLSLLWTYDRTVGEDVPIHRIRSDDGGRTWTEPASTGIAGQVAYPAALSDGRVLMSYVDRFGARSIRARLSDDEGATWNAAAEVVLWLTGGADDVIQNHGDQMGEFLQSMAQWSFGLPCCQQLPDGDVFVTYYAGTPEAHGIHWARVRV